MKSEQYFQLHFNFLFYLEISSKENFLETFTERDKSEVTSEGKKDSEAQNSFQLDS